MIQVLVVHCRGGSEAVPGLGPGPAADRLRPECLSNSVPATRTPSRSLITLVFAAQQLSFTTGPELVLWCERTIIIRVRIIMDDIRATDHDERDQPSDVDSEPGLVATHRDHVKSLKFKSEWRQSDNG